MTVRRHLAHHVRRDRPPAGRGHGGEAAEVLARQGPPSAPRGAGLAWWLLGQGASGRRAARGRQGADDGAAAKNRRPHLRIILDRQHQLFFRRLRLLQLRQLDQAGLVAGPLLLHLERVVLRHSRGHRLHERSQYTKIRTHDSPL